MHILGLGRLPPILFLPCKPLHGLGRGLDIILTTISYIGFDARDRDGSRYRVGRREGTAMRNSSRPQLFSTSSQKKIKMWICSRLKTGAFLLYCQEMSSAIFESLTG